jgi:hypothetical protein
VKGPKSRRMALGVFLALLLGLTLWFANRPGPAPAKAGDCVTAPSGGKFATARCGSSDAKFHVLQVFDGQDANQCDQAPGTVLAVRDTEGSKQSVLCLASDS